MRDGMEDMIRVACTGMPTLELSYEVRLWEWLTRLNEIGYLVGGTTVEMVETAIQGDFPIEAVRKLLEERDERERQR